MQRIFRDNAPVAFVDIETTGGQAAWHAITEIAIVAAHGDVLDFEWQTLLNPGVTIPPSITALTGIDNDLVRNAPSFETVAHELRERLAGRLFVAHNVRFDYSFIRAAFQNVGVRWSAPTACTARMSRRLFPTQARHNLDTLIAVHGLHCTSRHRAMPDAAALWQFWRKLRAERPLDELDQVLAEVALVPSLPPHLPAELAEELPEKPGVYRFYGATAEGHDSLIYVGKANNLRQRVLSHFAGAHRDAKSQRLSEQTRRVDWTETAGELGALLLESREVRERQPVNNRKLRGGRVFTWYWPEADARPIAIEPGAAGETLTGNRFGLFKTAREAQKALRQLAGEHRLCVKLLGLENSEGSCFGYQIKRCRGACVGLEPAALHALRARMAMARWKFANWPYPGPIAIVERSSSGTAAAHVVDQWQLLGTVHIDPLGQALDRDELLQRCRSLLDDRRDASFNADVYRILVASLRKLKNPGGILQLG